MTESDQDQDLILSQNRDAILLFYTALHIPDAYF